MQPKVKTKSSWILVPATSKMQEPSTNKYHLANLFAHLKNSAHLFSFILQISIMISFDVLSQAIAGPKTC